MLKYVFCDTFYFFYSNRYWEGNLYCQHTIFQIRLWVILNMKSNWWIGFGFDSSNYKTRFLLFTKYSKCNEWFHILKYSDWTTRHPSLILGLLFKIIFLQVIFSWKWYKSISFGEILKLIKLFKNVTLSLW